MAQELPQGFEIPSLPERTAEMQIEKPTQMPEASAPAPAPVAYVPVAPAPVPVQPARDQLLLEVEAVLSENIGELYKKLPAEKKQLFKTRGEQVATQIGSMLRSGILRIKKILELIREWLKLIPGVNHFFLEQEAKLKADKIQLIYEREHQPAV